MLGKAMNPNDLATLIVVFVIGMLPAIVSCLDLYIQGKKEAERARLDS